ncbi:M1 family metallopeptidase [Ferruginibacter sp. SUN106]|uniref:M1 family metallopeptidase n=1 Tax=Ferruginibacter sp. SUN106 TaxID=2978348 RepID=UPI003D36E5D5
MKKILALVIVSYCLVPIAWCQLPSYWQQQVNYKIDVTLNDADNTLDGFVKMDYINNSPDTLYFIWIHLWPNAYKNDRTAFSDQQLENGSTAFYFADNDKHGYINRLNFRVNSITAKTEDHPQHQDIIKLILPTPLAPKNSCKIETPFHVKLPYNFSRGGHVEQAYQATQWYPKPAVYDRKGWHPIPYLDQGEFYSEFGNYEVQITLPENYVVAATGDLQEQDEKNWLKARKAFYIDKKEKKKITITSVKEPVVASSKKTKTLHYLQNNVHDFAWFADKTFSVKTDALQLPSGRIITVNIFYYAINETIWANSIALTKQAILTKSKWLGEYPYNVVSVVDGGNGGGMEYPTITLLDAGGSEKMLDFVINHEVGHNWFYGILASNERLHPWMDEGMNTYYDNRYALQQYGNTSLDLQVKPAFIKNRLPADIEPSVLQALTNAKKDQPIATASENFNVANYNMVAYTKTGQWMKLLENTSGRQVFDSCMKEYYHRWSFKHPYPEDFKKVLEEVSGKNLDSAFSLLNTKGSIVKNNTKKDIRFAFLFNARESNKHHYISFLPAVGYNFYDKLMLGGIFHNYTFPASKFQFVAAPLYSSKSKRINGIGRISYSWFPGNKGQKAELSVSGASFNGDTFTDSTAKLNYLYFSKIVPSLKFVFANKNPRSRVTKFVQWKTFLINEQQLLFTRDDIRQIDIITYPVKSRYINQLQFVLENNRALYPYKGNLSIDQGDGFVRTAFTGNYFFNYAKGGGMNMRIFAGKFFYTGDKTFIKQFETDPYHLNMTGPKGYEDYTYSNYFFGRNEFDKFSAQQIMARDGAFKVRTDLLSNKIGKTDDWLAAANFTTDIPKNINPLQMLPVKIPLKAFLDIGTYAEAWQKNAVTGRFVYDAGLQLSLFKNVLNVYFPLLYSKVYKDYFLSTIPEKRFVKTISFSIDIQNVSLRKLIPQIPF